MEYVLVAPPSFWRQLRPCFVGVLLVVALSTLSDALFHAIGIYPPAGEAMAEGMFALPLAYRTVFGVLGSYLAARLAPSRPMTHALALGAIGTLAATAGLLATAGRGPEFGPSWYPLALVITALPNAWLGGRLAK